MILYICDCCGVQLESDEPLAQCKCGGHFHQLRYQELPEPEESDELCGECEYDPGADGFAY